jgi:hypothetical protein
MTRQYDHLLWPEGQEPKTVGDLKRRQLTLLVEAGLGDDPSTRQLASELDPNYQPGPTHLVAQVPMRSVPKPQSPDKQSKP